MNYCKRIVICSDFLSTSDTEQLSNLSWLFDSLKNPISSASGKTVQRFAAKELTGFSRKQFFALSGVTLNLDALQFDFDPEAITAESINYLKEFLQEDALLLGYEFSRRTRAIMDKFGFTYIDLWLHPIRYLDDVLFGFSSNNKEIFKALSEFNYSESHFTLYADRHKVATYKGYKRVAKEIQIEAGSALLVGQTLQDKAVLENGRFLNLLDYKDEILELAEKHSVVYFSRHPFEKDDKKIMKFLGTIDNLVVTDTPVYSLLAKDELKTVAGISSSVVMEGRYFGKQAQYFFQPIFELSTTYSLNSYISVFQDFLYPQFWSKVLAPVTKTNDVEPIKFDTQKDKIRDMLGFYWSYKHVDKIEGMRGTLTALDRRVQRMDRVVKGLVPKPKPKSVKPISRKSMMSVVKDNEQVWNEITRKIDSASIISFDIFDTLLVRPFEIPNDLFTYMEPLVEQLTGGGIVEGEFRALREKARGLVKDSKCGEEVSLKERYIALGEHAGISKKEAESLHSLELELELKTLYAREFMVKVFEYAKLKGKRVIIVSDTFFTSKFLEEALSKNGITGYELLWSSMEIGLLKHTGNVYPKLIEELQCEPQEILHIGDNLVADIQKADSHGLNTLHIPRTVDFFKERSGLDKSFDFENITLRSLIKGLVANKVMDNPLSYSYPSHSSGSRYLLGYSMVGPMFYGFAKWTMERAMKEGVDKLFFLARDGEIIKKCYDEIAKNVEGAPVSEYIHVSRRALSVPSIKTVEDIVEIAKLNYSPTNVKKLLKSRFGLDNPTVSKSQFKAAKIDGFAELINSNCDSDRFIALCMEIQEQILSNASIERENILEYLTSKGLTGKEYTYVVDIGHNGTLQKRLNILLETDNINGMYFVTQSGVKETIYDNGWKAHGYVAEEINGSDSRYPYNKYLLMFETCFLNEDGSMVSFDRVDDGSLVMRQLPVDGEEERINFIKETQSGVLDFTADICQLEMQLGINMALKGRESINPYLAMLKHPYELDLLMYDKVGFENVFSGRDNKYLLYYNPESLSDSKDKSYWNEHLNVLNWDECKDHLSGGGVKRKLIITAVEFAYKIGYVSDSKYKKFQKNPKVFFEDSRHPSLQKIGNYF
jgi:predicted HAD superfamily hydrolase